MSIDRPSNLAEAGFGILELLMALAIASLVVIAIGVLFAVGIKTRDRSAENAVVLSTLIGLQALSALAGNEVGVEIGAPRSDGFQLRDQRATDGMSRFKDSTVQLRSDEAHFRLDLVRGNRTSSVDLSIFESAAIEYWIVTPQASSWRKAEGILSSNVLAARVRLQLGPRVWRPLIWIASVWDEPVR